MLFREPVQRTSKAGKAFVTATIHAKDGDASQWWKVVAFSETAQAELMRLTDGGIGLTPTRGQSRASQASSSATSASICSMVSLAASRTIPRFFANESGRVVAAMKPTATR